jgi:hypothetical protein
MRGVFAPQGGGIAMAFKPRPIRDQTLGEVVLEKVWFRVFLQSHSQQTPIVINCQGQFTIDAEPMP